MSWPVFGLLVAFLFLGVNIVFGLIYATMPGQVVNAAHAVASVEILTGLFFSATMTGFILARLARPRESLAFSRVAVIGRYEGKRALMVRVVSIRSRPPG
ncbi:hypothetical protein [uncultured Sphingomonas sp.]|uniref:hypothetical protein n=1 Tax=uncultured Sphingomonas sp. TaxID=158754 RepID=UPI0035CBB713